MNYQDMNGVCQGSHILYDMRIVNQEQQIKEAAKRGDKQSATILAKQLVNLRKTKNKSTATGARVKAIGNQSKVMNSNMKMAEAMGTTTKVRQLMQLLESCLIAGSCLLDPWLAAGLASSILIAVISCFMKILQTLYNNGVFLHIGLHC